MSNRSTKIMGYKLVKHLESTQYNRKLFYLDNDERDLPPIVDKTSIQPGSECRSLANGDKWVLNTKYEWIHILDGNLLHDVPFEPVGQEYVRKTADDGHGYWVPTHFVEQEEFDALLKDLNDGLYSVSEYDETKTYIQGQEVIYEDTLYSCAVGESTPGPFKPNEWNEINKEPANKIYTQDVLYHAGDIVIINNPSAPEESYLVRVKLTHIGQSQFSSVYLDEFLKPSAEFNFNGTSATFSVKQIDSTKIYDSTAAKTQNQVNAEVQTKLAELSNTIAQNKQSSENADDQLEQSIETLNTELSQTIQTNKTATDQSIENLSETVANNKQSTDQTIATLTATVTNNKQSAETAIAQVQQNLNTQVQTIQNLISDIQETLTSQGQDITSAASTASAAQSQVNQLSSQLSTLSSSLNSAISGLQSTVNDLEDRVSSLERRI